MGKDILQYVQPSSRPLPSRPLTIRGNFLFLSDFEIPFHDARFINQVFALAKQVGIDQCVWGGDAMHLEAFSPFPGGDTDAEQEISEIDEFLPGFLEPFSRVYWIMGNHDDRAARMLNRKIKVNTTIRMFVSKEVQAQFYEKVSLSEHYWCRAEGNWYLEHQKNNSKTPTKVAQELTGKLHANVITAHTHKFGCVRYNGFWAVDAGCGVDPRRLKYYNSRHTTHTTMQKGAVLMLDGVPYAVCPENISSLSERLR